MVRVSEAGGGFDPGRSIATRAELVGDRYVVNGSKMWISGVDKAQWGVLYARTGAGGQRAGMSLKKIGLMRSYQPFEIHFDNYEIPVEDRLGEEDEGFSIAEATSCPWSAGTASCASAASVKAPPRFSACHRP